MTQDNRRLNSLGALLRPVPGHIRERPNQKIELTVLFPSFHYLHPAARVVYGKVPFLQMPLEFLPRDYFDISIATPGEVDPGSCRTDPTGHQTFLQCNTPGFICRDLLHDHINPEHRILRRDYQTCAEAVKLGLFDPLGAGSSVSIATFERSPLCRWWSSPLHLQDFNAGNRGVIHEGLEFGSSNAVAV